jgi:CheY-like chemotaxis protein
LANEAILIVEDNEANRKLIYILLSRAGYDVCTAGNAEEALSVIETRMPRLILMDLQLPGMDGLELTRRLKADASTSSIVVLAITAYAMKGDDQKAYAAGCDGYVAKPIDTRQLASTIEHYLSLART